MIRGAIPDGYMFSFTPELEHPIEIKEEKYAFSGNDFSSPESSPTDVPQVEKVNGKTNKKSTPSHPRTPAASKNGFQELPTSPESKNGDKKHKVSEKRAEQNRQAQKSFRERKIKYVRELEEKLEEASKQGFQVDLLKQENSDLRNVIVSLQKENELLKKEKQEFLNFTWNPNIPVDTKEGFDLVNGFDNFHDFSTSSSNSGSPESNHVIDISSPQDLQSVPCPEDLISTPPAKEEIFTVPQEGTVWESEIESFLFPENVNNNENFLTFEDPSLVANINNPITKSKRNIEEADFYSNFQSPFAPTALTKDEYGARDEEEDEICDLFKQIHCKDKNPELCHSSKFVKKAI